LYKLKNATKSFKFYKSIQYFCRLARKYELCPKENKPSGDRVVRLTSANIKHLINAAHFAAEKIALELREGDGYMPVLLAALAAISVFSTSYFSKFHGIFRLFGENWKSQPIFPVKPRKPREVLTKAKSLQVQKLYRIRILHPKIIANHYLHS